MVFLLFYYIYLLACGPCYTYRASKLVLMISPLLTSSILKAHTMPIKEHFSNKITTSTRALRLLDLQVKQGYSNQNIHLHLCTRFKSLNITK